MNTSLVFRYLYIAFIGLLVANLASVGIIAFFPTPVEPDAPKYPKPTVQNIPSPPSYSYTAPSSPTQGLSAPGTANPKALPSATPTPNLTYLAALRNYQEQQIKASQKYQRDLKKYEKSMDEYEAAQEKYENNSARHTEYTLLLYIGVAVFFALLGVALLKRFPVIAEGLVVGGAYLLYYFADPLGVSDSGAPVSFTPIGFVILLMATAVTLGAAYFAFIKHGTNQVTTSTTTKSSAASNK